MDIQTKTNLITKYDDVLYLKELISVYDTILVSISEFNLISDRIFSVEGYISNNVTALDEYTLLINRYASKIQIQKQYLVNSLIYYNSELRANILSLSIQNQGTRSSNFKADKYDFMFNLLKFSIASYYNLINALYEEKTVKYSKFTYFSIALFESSPYDQDILDFAEEIQKIEESAYKNIASSKYYPIVRFSTNRKIFKEIVSESKPDIYHFTCHGNKETLAFTSPSGTTDLFKVDKFIEYLETLNTNYVIQLIYLNSCDSFNYARKLKKTKSVNFKVLKTIGYIGENLNNHATKFSTSYYDSLFSSSRVEVCNAFQKTKKDYLEYDPFHDRRKYLNRLVITKR